MMPGASMSSGEDGKAAAAWRTAYHSLKPAFRAQFVPECLAETRGTRTINGMDAVCAYTMLGPLHALLQSCIMFRLSKTCFIQSMRVWQSPHLGHETA